MNKIKNSYSTPEADLLVIRFEQNYCLSTNEALNNVVMDGDWEIEE